MSTVEKSTDLHLVSCHTQCMGTPSGFSFKQRKNGEVVISHHGRVATILRGRQADAFLMKVETTDSQELMARLTGNYKRGNERGTPHRA